LDVSQVLTVGVLLACVPAPFAGQADDGNEVQGTKEKDFFFHPSHFSRE
jgi:hypothetical protein